MNDFETISLDEVKKYIENLQFKGSPFFCELCPIIRGTPNLKKTYLNQWESMLYKSRNMCSKCFTFINENRDNKDLEERMKLFENITNIKLKVLEKQEKENG